MATGKRSLFPLKTVRVTGWLLLIVVALYIFSGFAMAGKLGFNRLISAQDALAIHKTFDWTLVVLYLVHSAFSVYLALRRWGWIGR